MSSFKPCLTPTGRTASGSKYAYCPAALAYLEPVTYTWHRSSDIRAGPARPAVSTQRFDVDCIRPYVHQNAWPPDYSGDWGATPGSQYDFPGLVFTPKEWVEHPKNPSIRAKLQVPQLPSVAAQGQDPGEEIDATEAASDVDDPPRKYQPNRGLQDAQDTSNTGYNLLQPAADDSQLTFDQTRLSPEPNGPQDTFVTNPFPSQAEHPQDTSNTGYNLLQPAADNSQLTFDSTRLSPEPKGSQDTFVTNPFPSEAEHPRLISGHDPWQSQANNPEDSIKTTSTLPLPRDNGDSHPWQNNQVSQTNSLFGGLILQP